MSSFLNDFTLYFGTFRLWKKSARGLFVCFQNSDLKVGIFWKAPEGIAGPNTAWLPTFPPRLPHPIPPSVKARGLLTPPLVSLLCHGNRIKSPPHAWTYLIRLHRASHQGKLGWFKMQPFSPCYKLYSIHFNEKMNLTRAEMWPKCTWMTMTVIKILKYFSINGQINIFPSCPSPHSNIRLFPWVSSPPQDPATKSLTSGTAGAPAP